MSDLPNSRARNLLGVLMILVGAAIGIASLSPLWLISAPERGSLMEVEGVAQDVDTTSWTRRGKKNEELYFSLGGKRFACSTSLRNFATVRQAILNGDRLTMLIHPERSGTVGQLWKYWEIKADGSTVVPFDEMLEEDAKGAFAFKVVAIAVGAVFSFSLVFAGLLKFKQK